jgi:hypothetical protein
LKPFAWRHRGCFSEGGVAASAAKPSILLNSLCIATGRNGALPIVPRIFDRVHRGKSQLQVGDANVLAMRLICGIGCLLIGAAMVSCRVETSVTEASADLTMERAPALEWVRTVDGWERVDTWFVETTEPPQLHPLVVAAGQGLVSLLALVACQRGR